MLSDILNRIYKTKNFDWRNLIFFIILVFFPPFIFSWPLLPNNEPFPFKTSIRLSEPDIIIEASSTPKELPLEGISKSLGSKDFFSTLFNIRTASMPIELCFNNYNKIYDGNREVDPQGLIDADEAGAISFKYRRLDNNSTEEIYVGLGKINVCKVLPIEGVVLENNFIVRNPLPINVKASPQGEGFVIQTEPKPNLHVKIYSKPGYFHIKWQNLVFVRNFLLFIFAWLVLLSSCITIWNSFRFHQKKGKQFENILDLNAQTKNFFNINKYVSTKKRHSRIPDKKIRG
ncbi:MAG: hypothetical protein V1867_06455 [Candidatus Falkowbacteria bacterium]